MRNILKLGTTLLAFTAIAALLLSFTNLATADRIAAQAGSAEEIYQPILPDATEFELREDLDVDEESGIVAVYEGLANGDLMGYGIETAPRGYDGPVTVYVGISADGTVTGIDIGPHTETPGLGDSIEEDDFREQFVDISADSTVADEVDSITGATVSSEAVTAGVQSALEVYNGNLQ